MEIHIIHAGMLKFDGGAMFGVVPKVLWNTLLPADDNNLCPIAMRCLLIEDDNRLILIDNGMGDKQPEKFFSHYYPHGGYTLVGSLKKAGFHPDDVTDVFHTHLHFDHCGGGVKYRDREKGIYEMTFKNAIYWSNEDHWRWANQPNAREKASFLKENLLPIEEQGYLHHIDIEKESPFPAFDIIYVDGHTDKQMLPLIKYKDKKILFAADLFPTSAHIPLPYIMSYDTRPLITLKEKEKYLNETLEEDYILFFEHDPHVECAILKQTPKGPRIGQTFPLNDVL